jgi:GT2 family glycosyltransferase
MTVHRAPRLSVVVLSYNGMAHLPECIQSVYAQTYTDYELIVVDNGSIDGSPAYLEREWSQVKLIKLTENKGFCVGMNRGVSEAQGQLVLLLNQDLILDQDCFGEMVASFDSPPDDQPLLSDDPSVSDIGAHQHDPPRNFRQESHSPPRPVMGVFPKVLFYFAPEFVNAFGADWYESCHWRDARVGLADMGAFETSETVFGSIFPAVLLEKSRFLDIGGFDPVFRSYCEDFDVCYRSNILGYRFVTAPKARIRHKYRASSTDVSNPLQSRFWFLRNYLLVFLKNYEWRNLRHHGFRIFSRYLGQSIRHAIRTRNRTELLLYFRVIGSLVKQTPSIIRSRKRIQNSRTFSDECFWRKEKVEDYNPYHVEGSIVLSLESMRTARSREKN